MEVTSAVLRTGLRVLNRIGEGLERVGIELVSLDEQRLLDAACRDTGIASFGDEGFREPLRLLLRSLQNEGRLTLLGRIAARADIAGLLATRLRLEADRKRYPGIADEVIRRPLFVVGLPRTGSTLLHHVLAQDPVGRVARAWEVMEPSPPPERARYDTDPRIGRAARRLAWFDRIAPDFKRIHPLGAELPLECIAIMSASFASPRFHTTYHVPSYQTWLASADLHPAYDFHRRFLQHLQWRAPAGHWVLKAPSHVFGFGPLFATYPDAIVVQTHRDPLTVLASVASLTLVLQGAFTDDLDPAEIGAEVTQRWSSGLERAMHARREARVDERFVDVRYQDLLRNPMAIVRRIYDRFGMTLSAEAEGRMRRFLARHPKDKHGAHRYTLSVFGLDARELGPRFKSYRERFELEPEDTETGPPGIPAGP
jgi:hypothetical protein